MQVTTVIREVKRRKNTVNGNPRWTLITDAGVFDTKANANCAHKLHEFHDGRTVTLTFDDPKKVYGIDLHY